MAAADSTDKEQVFLEADDEIRGQKYVCLSFLTPNRGLLRRKELFFFTRFLEFYALDYKVKATESFLMGKLRDIQTALGDATLDLANAEVEKSAAARDAAVERITKARETLARVTAADLEAHVKANMSDFRESTIVEEYEKFMVVNRQKLEDEFHRDNNFQTTVHGLKVRGVYSTQEQATARAKSLHKSDPYFNVYVADVGEWLPWDPDPEQVPESEYQNEELNKLMRQYKENASQREAFFQEQKRQKMAEAAAAAKVNKEAQAAERAAQVKTLKEQQAKGPVFGEQSDQPEREAGAAAQDMFGGEDLVLQRKRAAAGDSIQHS